MRVVFGQAGISARNQVRKLESQYEALRYD